MDDWVALLTACGAGIAGKEGLVAVLRMLAMRKVNHAKADAIWLRTNLDILTGPSGIVHILRGELEKAYERILALEGRVSALEAENARLREAG